MIKNKFFAAFVLCVLSLNAFGTAFADTKNKKAVSKNAAQTSQLVALLPASDVVATFDAKRFFSDALPQLLSANQPMLAEIIGAMDDLKAKTGIDPRQFEQIAAGMTARKISAQKYEFDPVIFARGQINAPALIATAKIAAKGKYKEEKIGDRTVYIFAVKEIAAANAPQGANPKKIEHFNKMAGKLADQIAVTAYDAATLAFGTKETLRTTLTGGTRVGADLTEPLYRKQNQVANFSAKLPGGMSAFLPLDNDELGKNLDAIRYVSGAMDVSGNNVTVQMTAKTSQTDQAQKLFETLEGLQMVGKALLGGAKGADKQVYARMIDNAKLTRSAAEVTLDLTVPQSDIDVLIPAKK